MEALVKFREAQRLTQKAFAALIGTSAGYLHDIETGRRRPSHLLARQIEEATGIPRAKIRPDIFGSDAPKGRAA